METYHVQEDATVSNGVLDAHLIDDVEDTDAFGYPPVSAGRYQPRVLVLTPVEQEKMRQHGRKLALESGAVEPDDLAFKALQNHAGTSSHGIYTLPFNCGI